MGSENRGLDLLRVQDEFAAAAEPYLQFPWSWLTWGLLLPIAALATRGVAEGFPVGSVFVLWFGVVLVGGLVEGVGIHFGRRRFGTSALAGWVMRAQGNLSLVAVLLTVALLVARAPSYIPGVWLLLLGHSFYSLGSLGFPPFRRFGLTYQGAGALALWPMLVDPMLLFALATGFCNLGIAFALWRADR